MVTDAFYSLTIEIRPIGRVLKKLGLGAFYSVICVLRNQWYLL